MFARFMKNERYLPFTKEDREAAGYKSDQPPLNAIMVATASFWRDLNVPPFAKLTHDVYRRYLADNPDNFAAWRVLNTQDPIAGELLFWYMGRWLSIVFSGFTLIVIYFIGLAIFEPLPGRHLWSLSAVMTVAFIPVFVLISSVLSYENLLGLWLALYLLTIVYIVKRGEPAWLYFLSGLFIGLGIATKLSALPGPLSLIAATMFVGYRQRWSWQKLLLRLSLGILGLLFGVGWWFALVISKLNRVEELGWVAGLIDPILAGDGSDSTASNVTRFLSTRGGSGALTLPEPLSFFEWLEKLFTTFWSLRLSVPEYIWPILFVVAAMILIGLGWQWWRNREARLWTTLLLLHISLFLILPFIRFVMTGPHTVKGLHILFPAGGAFAILMAWGLGAWLPRRWGMPWLGGILLGLGLLFWSVTQSIRIYQTPLPVWTVPPEVPSSAQAIDFDFGPIVLKGYDLNGLTGDRSCCDADHKALGFDLYWLVQEYADQDYLTEVRLVDSQGETQSIWLGHPADGRFPTRAWEPGDYVRDQIWLPVAGLESGSYTARLRLWGKQGPVVTDSQDGLVLAEINVSHPASLPEVSGRNAEQIIDIWQRNKVHRYSLQGDLPYKIPVFSRRSTIQIITQAKAALQLIGPDQLPRSPTLVEGRRHVFVIDPRWSEGEYRLQIHPENQSSFETDPVLFARSQGRNTQPPESQVKIQANFADQLRLLGYNLPQRQFMPGEHIPLTLHLQAIQEMPADFLMFTRLRDETGTVWGGRDRRPLGLYSTLLWAKDEIVEDGFTIQIDEEAPSGLYYLDVGFYLPVEKAAVSLPLVQDGEMQDVTKITIGPFKIGDPFGSDYSLDSAQPQHRLDQPFGDGPNLILLGYDLTRQSKSMTLTLYWQSVSLLSSDYTTFLHLRNTNGDTVAQQDRPPLNGSYPTSLWDPGEIIADEIRLPLPDPMPDDDYQVVVGLYDFQTGQRLSVPGSAADEVVLVDAK